MRIFLGNFEFEHELAQPTRAFASRQTAERDWIWVGMASPEDVVLVSRIPDAADLADWRRIGIHPPKFCDQLEDLPSAQKCWLVPWGASEPVRKLATAKEWTTTLPPLEIVRELNRRSFRARLEIDLQIGLPRMAVVDSIDDLMDWVASRHPESDGWILKAEFGMAGREAIRGAGLQLSDNQRNWALRRLADVGPIVCEPFVPSVSEAGIQWEIPETGDPVLVGIAPLLIGPGGVYRGSRFGLSAQEEAEWYPAVEVGRKIANQIQELGYYGPLGIDAMRYRDATGTIQLRPLQDLNARYTMGRIALEIGRKLNPPASRTNAELSLKQGSWLHFSRRQLGSQRLRGWIDSIATSLPSEVKIAPISPRASQAMESCLVFATSDDASRLGEQVMLNIGSDEQK